MTFVFISSHLIISESFKKFFRRFLQGKYDLINIFTCIINDVVVSITSKINILHNKKQITKKILPRKIGPSIDPWRYPQKVFTPKNYRLGLF